LKEQVMISTPISSYGPPGPMTFSSWPDELRPEIRAGRRPFVVVLVQLHEDLFHSIPHQLSSDGAVADVRRRIARRTCPPGRCATLRVNPRKGPGPRGMAGAPTCPGIWPPPSARVAGSLDTLSVRTILRGGAAQPGGPLPRIAVTEPPRNWPKRSARQGPARVQCEGRQLRRWR
jgi:hypothetical protein